MEKKTIKITEDQNERLDVFLTEETELTRSRIKKLIDEGSITLNGLKTKSKIIPRINDEITIKLEDNKELDLTPKNIPLDIVYQDDDLAVINKQQGLTVHAGCGTNGDTLVNALLFHLDSLSGINGVLRPGIVHRIDKNTSGLIVVAKNDKAHLSLSKQIETKTCGRTYIALLEGVLPNKEGRIETYLERSNKDRTMMMVSNKGRLAITYYQVLKYYDGYTLCEFKLKTGRTHQIRVHAKYLGHPIVGDDVYGNKKQKFNLNGQLLHAYKLEFRHPTTQQDLVFTADLPAYFEEILRKLKEK